MGIDFEARGEYRLVPICHFRYVDAWLSFQAFAIFKPTLYDDVTVKLDEAHLRSNVLSSRA